MCLTEKDLEAAFQTNTEIYKFIIIKSKIKDLLVE